MGVYQYQALSGSLVPIAGSATDMQGASASTAGTHGLVPQPQAGDQDKYLRANGTWDYAGNDSLVAFVETTSTSARNYAVGDQFVLNRKLYTATNTIEVGDTLTPGTNCEESDNVTKQIEELQWMNTHNRYYAMVADDDGTVIADDDGTVILGDWKYQIV